MSPIEYLQQHVVSILKPSKIHGVGVFAICDIEVDKIIFQPWLGESGVYSITHEELFTLPEELQKYIYEGFHNDMVYIDKESNKEYVEKEYGKIFFPLENGIHWLYTWPIIHLNSGLKNANVNTNNAPCVSLRNIKKGEELLGNYGSNFKLPPRNLI